MKATKRKRSAKAQPVIETAGADVVVAEVPVVAEPVVEQKVEPVVDVAIEQTAEVVAEPVVEAVVAEPVANVSNEQAVEMSAETPVEQVNEVVAEPAVAGEPIVVLGSNCSVKDAAALKTSLCALSNRSDAVTLDVSAVERVDTATMQLLCAFVRDRSGRKQGVTWRGESAALRDAVRLLGVAELLGLQTQGVAA